MKTALKTVLFAAEVATIAFGFYFFAVVILSFGGTQ